MKQNNKGISNIKSDVFLDYIYHSTKRIVHSKVYLCNMIQNIEEIDSNCKVFAKSLLNKAIKKINLYSLSSSNTYKQNRNLSFNNTKNLNPILGRHTLTEA